MHVHHLALGSNALALVISGEGIFYAMLLALYSGREHNTRVFGTAKHLYKAISFQLFFFHVNTYVPEKEMLPPTQCSKKVGVGYTARNKEELGPPTICLSNPIIPPP